MKTRLNAVGKFLSLLILFGLAGFFSGTATSQAFASASSDCEFNICNIGTGDCAFAPEEEWNCKEILGGCEQSECEPN